MFRFPELIPHLPFLLQGLWLTVLITLGGMLVALVCAFVAGLGRLSVDPIVRTFAGAYVEVFRGTSALVQLFWFYFALPLLLGIQLEAVTVGILVLGLNVGAYGAEVVRGAVEAVPRGQHLAALALNFTPYQRMRYVILPQAVPAMLPPFGNLAIELLKGTALVSMITVTDLTRAGMNIRDNTLATTAIFVVLLAMYFVLAQILAAAIRWLEDHYRPAEQQGAPA